MYFLEAVANNIIEKYGSDLSRTVVVFPNKRASLFLNEELVKAVIARSDDGVGKDTSLWSPLYLTISELFRDQSSLIVADHIKLVCELYDVYVRVTGRKSESLDEFYSWGELLLSDFDDVDKNMADPKRVFENTAELHAYDTDDFLMPEQREVLKKFFENFTDNHDSELKRRFEELWNRLGDIYATFRETLRSKGIAYEGMLYRDVIEQKTLSSLPGERYLFVGFNLLQKVEQELFAHIIREHGEAHFYWDYDEYYCNVKDSSASSAPRWHEAGQYIRQYISKFPNELPSGDLFCNFSKPKDITYISASTEDVQARYVSQWLTPERIKAGKRTAIVLCNENLLPTVVNCLPEAVEHVNITTGYPLADTPISTLVRQYLNLFIVGNSKKGGKFRLHAVKSVLRHSYMRFISPLNMDAVEKLDANHIFFPTQHDIALDDNLSTLFASLPQGDHLALCDRLMWIVKTIATSGGREDMRGDALMQESLYRMYTLINRLRALVANDGLDVDAMTFQRLLLLIIRTTSVPYHGEPVVGIQIMGVLETRNLDFDHVLLLSCNEGNMPKGVNDSSFIPHAIRKVYGLTTVENKVAIYAYYFHRLLQRAGDIEITYNSSTEDGQTGERSRFMLQLMAESNLPIVQKTFSSHISTVSSQSLEVIKDDSIMERLMQLEKLSPSEINTYLRCPLRFYFKILCGISDMSEDDEAEVDNIVFGLIYHKAMELIYKPFERHTLSQSTIESLIKDKRIIRDAIDKGIMIEVFKADEENVDITQMPELNGSELIIRKVIHRLIVQTLEYDAKHAPLTIKNVERGFSHRFTFPANGTPHQIKITGIIDRYDVVSYEGRAQARIVDYKTGRSMPDIASVDDIFNPEKIGKHGDYYLQTLLYSIVMSNRDNIPVAPALLYPARTRNENYQPILTFGTSRGKNLAPITNAVEWEKEFTEHLSALLSEIFDTSRPFAPTVDGKRCKDCVYAHLCK